MAIRTTQNMVPASTTHYVYDRAGKLIVEATSAGATLTEYIWLDDMPLAVVAEVDTMSPKLWYVHADHLDRPARMTDAGKVVVWDAYYWPFGEARAIAGTATNNMRFPGQYFLVESGLAYNWHRHYDPTLGRYLQADPIADVLMTKPAPTSAMGAATADRLPTLDTTRDGGTQLTSTLTTGSKFESVIGQELPQFLDGSAIYNYARLGPTFKVDPNGLMVSGPYTPIPKSGASCDIDDRVYRVASVDPAREKNCAALRDNIINYTCKSIKHPFKRAACFAAAEASYLACLYG